MPAAKYLVVLREPADAFLARTMPSLRGIQTRVCGMRSVALHGDKDAVEALLTAEMAVVQHYSHPDTDGPDKQRLPPAPPRSVNRKQLVQIGVALFVLIAMALMLHAHAAARAANTEI